MSLQSIVRDFALDVPRVRLSDEELDIAIERSLPIESDAKAELLKAKFGKRWPPISLDFLRLRDSRGFPVVAMCRNQQTCCRLSCFITRFPFCLARPMSSYDIFLSWSERETCKLFESLFSDVKEAIAKAIGRNCDLGRSEAEIAHSMACVVPWDMREELELAESRLSRIYFVREADTWHISVCPYSQPGRQARHGESLIIGLHDSVPHCGFQVAMLDDAPVERMVRKRGT